MASTLLRAAAMSIALLFILAPARLPAQDVTLMARDGGVSVDGTLLSYDGAYYQVDTLYGELTLDAQGVICEGPGCPDLTRHVAEFGFAGTPIMGTRLIPALLEGFARGRDLRIYRENGEDGLERAIYVLLDPATAEPVARVGVKVSSSDAGLVSLLAGETELALSLAELDDPEVRARVVGLDAFVPVVSPHNPLRTISVPDLVDALSGEVTTWEALGRVEDLPIRLHAHAEGSGVQQALEAQLLGPRGLPMADTIERHAAPLALAARVARDPMALGVTLASQSGGAKVLPLTGACGFQQSATPLAVKAEDYPLTLPLLLHMRAERLPLLAREFLDFLSTERAQRIIRRIGFIDLGAEAIALDQQGRRLANAIAAAGESVELTDLQALVAELEGTERLSSTFRFAPGETRLDAPSRDNVRSLARALEAGLYDGRELVFAGFTDGDGPSEVNLRIAHERATEVRDAVREAAPLLSSDRVALRVAAFGEAMPIACDDSEQGRQSNRRVEVWLR